MPSESPIPKLTPPRQKDRPPEQTLFRRENAQQQNRESGDGKQRGRRKHPWMGVGIGSGLLWIGPGMDKEEEKHRAVLAMILGRNT